MSDDTLITVDQVSKKFCRSLKKSLWYGMQDLGAELIGRDHGNNGQLRNEEFWAVNEVSFELKRGQCLGLIGRNGAGKSTLLKMLNGLIKPDKGRIEMRGRVGALIELGAGFNPILTGRENIYNNGAILGFSKAEINKRFDAIVAFSEIEDFIDTPVQYYSSGMRVRLGFAVASQMEPDILLIDEVLAVGDIGFVLKCFNRMDELLSRCSIILVSHNIPQIARMCTNLVVMKTGQAIYNSDDVPSGITAYYSAFDQQIGHFVGDDRATLEEISLHSNGRSSTPGENFTINYGEELRVRIRVKLKGKVKNPRFGMAFYDREQRNFAEVGNCEQYIQLNEAEGELTVEARFPAIEFAQGMYSITISFRENLVRGRRILFRMQSAIYFMVQSSKHGWAPMQFTPEWQLVQADP